MPNPRRQRGDAVERAAEALLRRHGLVTLERNFGTRWGEIDLVMEDGPLLVFVEVRFRVNDRFGGAVASVTPAKQARILRAAAHFLEQRRLAHRPVRFDIVAAEGADVHLEWLKDAFRPEC